MVVWGSDVVLVGEVEENPGQDSADHRTDSRVMQKY